jgi:DNA-binding transcriptional regulator YdaS (Cro superfamily)
MSKRSKKQDQTAARRSRKTTSGIARVIALAGSQEALAQQLGVSQQAVQKWAKRGYIPPGRAVEVEAQYGVPRRDLLDPRLTDLVEGLG